MTYTNTDNIFFMFIEGALTKYNKNVILDNTGTTGSVFVVSIMSNE